MPPKKKGKSEGPHWEFNDGSNWVPYADADAQLLETAYQKGKTFTTSDLSFNKGYTTKYVFDFSAMTQTNQDSGTVRNTRRHASSSEIAWEWVDDNDMFVPFFAADTAEIERLFVSAGLGCTIITKALSFNKGYDSPYEFMFNKKEDDGSITGTQMNKESKTVRKIRRLLKVPAPWEVSGYGIAAAKEVPAEVAEVIDAAPAATSAPAAAASDEPAPLAKANTMSVPSNWTAKKGMEGIGQYAVVKLDASADKSEYDYIANSVRSSIGNGKSAKVMSVVRVENVALWAFYAVTKSQIAKRHGGEPNERLLFYGERSAANIATICKLGFDTRVAQFGNCGQGVYFGVKADHCNKGLCKENKDGSKELFVCRVAVGEGAQGNKTLRRPPPKDPKKPTGELYDSCFDSAKNSSVHVVYNNNQAYPAYIVKYS